MVIREPKETGAGARPRGEGAAGRAKLAHALDRRFEDRFEFWHRGAPSMAFAVFAAFALGLDFDARAVNATVSVTCARGGDGAS